MHIWHIPAISQVLSASEFQEYVEILDSPRFMKFAVDTFTVILDRSNSSAIGARVIC